MCFIKYAIYNRHSGYKPNNIFCTVQVLDLELRKLLFESDSSYYCTMNCYDTYVLIEKSIPSVLVAAVFVQRLLVQLVPVQPLVPQKPVQPLLFRQLPVQRELFLLPLFVLELPLLP